MSEAVITALISLVGTAAGSLGGIIASQRLTEHGLDRSRRSRTAITPSSSGHTVSRAPSRG
ncbi:MAG: hypothetical protein IJT56_07455 [Clostridia bacterium]|nr:hypothetical protein [Clostridia bacterium]